jgi:hypothetical protein
LGKKGYSIGRLLTACREKRGVYHISLSPVAGQMFISLVFPAPYPLSGIGSPRFHTIFQKEESLKEQEIIESLRQGNEDFRKLYDEHHVLDGTLAEMDKKVYLTPEEEIERKKLQKQKLSKKDKMAEMVRDYKKSNP